MNKKRNIIIGIVLWISVIVESFFQIYLKKFSVNFQFFFFLIVLLIAVANEISLIIKLYLEKKNKKIFIQYYFWCGINLLFVVFCFCIVAVIYLFF